MSSVLTRTASYTRLFQTAILAVLLLTGLLISQSRAAETADQPLSGEQLEQLVAPIALHPDDLLSQILMASTPCSSWTDLVSILIFSPCSLSRKTAAWIAPCTCKRVWCPVGYTQRDWSIFISLNFAGQGALGRPFFRGVSTPVSTSPNLSFTLPSPVAWPTL